MMVAVRFGEIEATIEVDDALGYQPDIAADAACRCAAAVNLTMQQAKLLGMPVSPLTIDDE